MLEDHTKIKNGKHSEFGLSHFPTHSSVKKDAVV